MNIEPFDNFQHASRATLSHLYQRFGFALWMVTRTEGDDWQILFTEDHGYDISEGQVFRWSDSFCKRMVAGQGPQFAPRTGEIPVYVSAEIGSQLDVGAYIGMPLRRVDGSLFGTLCAIDPVGHEDLEQRDRDLIELLATLLSTVLTSESRTIDQMRREATSDDAQDLDAETGLLDGPAWERVLAAEEATARDFGSPACVVSIELSPGPSSSALHHVAGIVRRMVRETDFAARVGEHTFAVLMVECGASGGARFHRMVQDELAAAGIAASVGWATREPSTGIEQAWKRAEAAAEASRNSDRPAD
jgi:GAF domain-containing protein